MASIKEILIQNFSLPYLPVLATTVTTVKHTVRGLDYQVPANFTNPPTIRGYYFGLVSNARFDAIIAYVYQNYLFWGIYLVWGGQSESRTGVGQPMQ